MADYDAIVVGVGGMGSAALCALAHRGARVCGVERFGIAHDRGSSHGETRIIRKAYFEHPDYVPLLDRAYELWAELEEASGASLFSRCGFLACGHPDSPSIVGLEACYEEHDLPHERLDRDEVVARYPQVSLDSSQVGFFDPTGGYLRVEECVRRLAGQAVAAGADLLTETHVVSWRRTGTGVIVRTADREITADRLILTTGAWAVPELARLGVVARIWRKVLLWYAADDMSSFVEGKFPTFFFDTEPGHFYGFPVIDETGLKIAEHRSYTLLDDPDRLDTTLHAADERAVLDFMASAFPSFAPRRTRHVVCMYTVTPDHHFVVDRLPDAPQVVVGVGFSGHGFKFATVIGEILADLATDGRTRHAIGFLGLDRFR